MHFRKGRNVKRTSFQLGLAALAAAALVAACGGGGLGSPGAMAMATVSGANPGAASSGIVTAFGSVFVNGHEFNIASAKLIDDDDPTSSPAASSLEVGMSVDVKAAGDSSDARPSAAELHLHPLVRGYVDGSSTGAGTLTVMGQTVQLTAATNFSDHRACLTASTSPCTPITGQSGLMVTGGSASSAVTGNYVTVHGYLFNPGSGSTNVVATLVSVADVSATTRPAAFKVEGQVTAPDSGTGITIGGLSVDLSLAKCFASGAQTPCNGAFSVGAVVSAIGAKAPPLPATTFQADAARAHSALVIEAPGAAIEIEGKVSSLTASPAGFVVRGISVLSSGALPAVGDIVEVTGTVAGNGTSVAASAVKVLHPAHAPTFAFEGDVATVATGSAADTFALTLLSQSITVNSSTRLADRSLPDGDAAQASDPFNIATFQSYLAASKSQHVLVRTQASSSGALTAMSVTIVPASGVSSVGGLVDATPTPVNATVGGAKSTTFLVHGLAVTADPAAVIGASGAMDGAMPRLPATSTTVAAGDRVLVRGTFAPGGITVAPPSGMPATLSRTNLVIDFGVPKGDDHDGF
jgi:hypothetical protein